MTTKSPALSPFVAGTAGAELLDAVRALAPRLRESVGRTDGRHTVDGSVIAALREAGVFRMTMPSWLGGPELDPVAQIEVVEELSRVDGSVGWVAMIGSDGGYYSTLLGRPAAEELYGRNLDVVTAGFTDPVGTAEVVPTGYLVSGRWPFGSACEHAVWLASGVRVTGGTGTGPEWRVMMLPADRCRIEQTWFSTGLRGTGSHHYSADRVFVPAHHSFSFVVPAGAGTEAPPFVTMHRANMAGVPLGIAKAGLEATYELLRHGNGRLRDDPFVHAAVAKAEALVGAARAFMVEVVGDLHRTLSAGQTPSMSQRSRFRLALTTVFTSCREAVDLLYRHAGGTAVYADYPLERRFRDIVTAGQHALVQPKSFATIGRALLGIDPGEQLF